MGIWETLFGKKVTLQFRDKAGSLVERKISEAKFKKLEASGAISKTEVVEVHVLDPKGNYSTTWEIGKDISPDIARQARDPQSGALHALTTYEGGNPTTHVCKKEHWLAVKAQFDAIEQDGSDAIARSDYKHPRQRNANPKDEEDRIIGFVLQSLGKCKSHVVVGSPHLDKRYTGDLIVNSRLYGHHLSSLVEKGQIGGTNLSVCKALVIWLQGADILDAGASGITSSIYGAIQHHVPELVNTQIAQMRCRQCNALHQAVKVEEVTIDSTDIYVSWKLNWICPSGHLLFSDFQDMHMSISD